MVLWLFCIPILLTDILPLFLLFFCCPRSRRWLPFFNFFKIIWNSKEQFPLVFPNNAVFFNIKEKLFSFTLLQCKITLTPFLIDSHQWQKFLVVSWMGIDVVGFWRPSPTPNLENRFSDCLYLHTIALLNVSKVFLAIKFCWYVGPFPAFLRRKTHHCLHGQWTDLF